MLFAPKTRQLLTDRDVDKINAALAGCAQRTSIRIVPAVAARSGQYEHAEDMVGLWSAALGLALVWWILASSSVGEEWIGEGPVWSGGIIPILLATVGGFLIGVLLSNRLGWLRRLFVTRGQLRHTVERRSEQMYATISSRQHSQPAILLYLGIYEKKANLVAPAEIKERLGAEKLQDILRRAESCIEKSFDADTFCQVLVDLANQLRETHPPQNAETPASKLQMVA